jgi:hypothetical protein
MNVNKKGKTVQQQVSFVHEMERAHDPAFIFWNDDHLKKKKGTLVSRQQPTGDLTLELLNAKGDTVWSVTIDPYDAEMKPTPIVPGLNILSLSTFRDSLLAGHHLNANELRVYNWFDIRSAKAIVHGLVCSMEDLDSNPVYMVMEPTKAVALDDEDAEAGLKQPVLYATT